MTAEVMQDIKPEVTSALFERVLNFRYALVTLSVALAIEVGRPPLRALGFPDFNWHAPQSSVPLGTLLVFAASYMFFMAALSPAIRLTLEGWLSYIRWSPLWYHLLGSGRSPDLHKQKYAAGFALVLEVERDALTAKDDFWIKRLDVHRARAKFVAESAQFMASVSFSCTLLLIAVWCGETTSWMHVAANWLFDADGNRWRPLMGAVILGMTAAPWAMVYFGRDERYASDRWMKHPGLAARRLKEIETTSRAFRHSKKSTA